MDPGAKDAEDNGRDGKQDEAANLAAAFLLFWVGLRRGRKQRLHAT
jgi:hypothetical protein